MKRKIISTILVITMISGLTIGCGAAKEGETDINKMSKSQLIEEYTRLQSEYQGISQQLADANTSLQALTGESEVAPAISVMGDGSGRFTFNSNDSKIIFPTSFVYPNSMEVMPDGKINIVNNVSITPSSSWISRINGSALELEKSDSQISGTIKVNEIDELYDVDSIQEDVLEPWFSNIANSSVRYSDVFIDSTSFGKQAETPIMINSENAYLICGMVGYASSSITYVFVYKGAQDSTKDEAIKNVLNTICINDNNLVVQN